MSITAHQEIKPKRAGQFKKGVSGNPSGRPKGSVNKYTALARGVLGEHSQAIVEVIIDKALKGDVNCLKMCLDRIIPTTKYAGTSMRDNFDEAPKIIINVNGGSLPEILPSGKGEDVRFVDEEIVVSTIKKGMNNE
jgi:hypothetical protein